MSLTIFYFRTDWCEICKKITPAYQWFSKIYFKKYNLPFYIVNLDNKPVLIDKFKIKEYPTFIIFKDNKEIYRQENGNLTLLKSEIDKLV